MRSIDVRVERNVRLVADVHCMSYTNLFGQFRMSRAHERLRVEMMKAVQGVERNAK
jgi:hypothetical protein